MKTASPRNNPIDDRIAYHLACIEARRNSQPEPEAPWLKKTTGEEISPAQSEPESSYDALVTPKKSRVSRAPRLSKAGVPHSPKMSRSREDESSNSTTVVPLPENKEVTLPPQSTRTVLAFPVASSPTPIPFLETKVVVVETLLLRAGIPPKQLLQENLAHQVVQSYRDFERDGGESGKRALVHKYEIGRHFCRNGMSHFGALAVSVIRLLKATDTKELTNARLSAEETVDRFRSA